MKFSYFTIILIFVNLYFNNNCSCNKHDKEFEYFKSIFENVPIPFSVGDRNVPIEPTYGARAESSTNPLFVSEYIYDGNITEARIAASVKPLAGDIISYAGLFTVDYSYNTNIFFWFFQSKQDWENAPLIIYMQGILLESTAYSVFEENGPYRLDFGDIELRNHSWIEKYNMLFIDSCPGVGFSFTQHEDGYFQNTRDFEFSLIRIIFQFRRLFPELKTNDLYLASSLYGAAGTLWTAGHIGELNHRLKEPIPLKGVFIGNGWIDPATQSDWSSHLYETGYFSSRAREQIQKDEELLRESIRYGQYGRASFILASIFARIHSQTGLINFMDRTKNGLDSDPMLKAFVQQEDIREATHVGSLAYQDGFMSFYYLFNSISEPVPDFVINDVLENSKVCFFSGQYDLTVPHSHTQNLLKEKSWSGSYEYGKAARRSWYADSKLAGYYKKSQNVTEVLILNSGAITSRSKPYETYALLNTFVEGSFE